MKTKPKRMQARNLYFDLTAGLRDIDLLTNLAKYFLFALAFTGAIFYIFTAFELWKFAGTMDGGIPLLIYFEGLRLTKASTAGYFEMMQTLAAVCITWGFFHAALRPHQVVAALVLMAAVTMVQRVQGELEQD